MASLGDRVALLLAIKETGKTVNLNHIHEKVSRDVSFVEARTVEMDEVTRALSSLMERDFVKKIGDEYLGTGSLQEYVKGLVHDQGGQLNRSYWLVWLAKNYYPKVARLILPFLEGRAVSAVKVFSGKKDPVREVDPIFVRYAKYKPKPVFLTIESSERLMELVFDHCVDFIPYIHKLDAKAPDVMVLDLDAGTELLRSPRSFELLKVVTLELAGLLLEKRVHPMMKFSGSRGFQIWASIIGDATRGDPFKACRDIAISMQKDLEEILQSKNKLLEDEFGELIGREAPITTSTVADKEGRASQILVDWSVLKPMGDVRAPFSIHHKTGLVSVPLSKEMMTKFKPDDAHPFKVLERLDVYEKTAGIRPSPISRLFD